MEQIKQQSLANSNENVNFCSDKKFQNSVGKPELTSVATTMLKPSLIRYKLIVEYDGGAYCGYQKQSLAHKKSVEEALAAAIHNFSCSDVKIFACGRTDAGVHALGQVVHFDLSKTFQTYQVVMGLNHHLRFEKIAILACELVDQGFHARFSTKLRHYRYEILNRQAPAIIDKNRLWHLPKPLDLEKMRFAANFLLGEHDFSSFRDSECQAKSPIRTIESIKIYSLNQKIFIEVSAKSFLHHMVRNIVGTLAYIGLNKIAAGDLEKILKAKNRNVSGPNAPAYGLYFLKADY